MSDLGVSLYQSYYSYKAYGAASLGYGTTTQKNSKNLTDFESSSRTKFAMDLEKHIRDYKKGRGYLSQETAKEVGEKSREVSQNLSQMDLKANTQFSGYLTVLAYDKRSRFINNVADATESLAQISKIA